MTTTTNSPISVTKRSMQARRKAPKDILKQPKRDVLGPATVEGRHLVWRFSRRDKDGPFSWGAISAEDTRRVWARLAEFEKMDASQLKEAASNHSAPSSEVSQEAKKRLRELQLDDQENLWSFRITQQRRFWCIKHENIYALLWWDPCHKVYPTKQK